jgi:hypothetical protein
MDSEPKSQESLVHAAWRGVMKDGTVAAFARMGVDELGQALKAFPDAIQARAEPGGLFEPLHQDIANAREQYAAPVAKSPLPSPSEIVHDSKAAVTVHGEQRDKEQSQTPSPSEIARESKAAVTAHGEQREGEHTHTPTPSEIAQRDIQPDGWANRVLEERERTENGGNDQNEQNRERSLPQEERERENSRGR